MLTRRRAVLGGIVTIFFVNSYGTRCFAHSHEEGDYKGCTLSAASAKGLLGNATVHSFRSGTEPIMASGNTTFDRALAHTLAKLTRTFGILPGFAYYDDSNGHNAYATSSQILNKSDGTVMFGLGLLGKLMAGNDHPSLSVAAICAHEFGHILQYKHGLMSVVNEGRTTVKRSELQADYFAGYFAGVRKREKPDFPAAVFAKTQHAFGDNMVEHPDHHGTPTERADAIIAGFNFAIEGGTVSNAITASTNYVRTV